MKPDYLTADYIDRLADEADKLRGIIHDQNLEIQRLTEKLDLYLSTLDEVGILVKDALK